MRKKHWDEIEISNLKKLYGEDPYKTKECIEDYITRYPEDYSALYLYIDILITIKEYDKAFEEIKRVKRMYSNDPKITKEKIEKFIEQFEERELIRYYLATHQYDYALDYLEYNRSIKSYIELELKLYCYKKLGIETKSFSTKYECQQIMDYSEERMINYIEEMNDSTITTPSLPSKRRFNSDFPLEKIIDVVKEKMKEENKLCYGYNSDMYVFKYDCCGRVDEKVQDYFKVTFYHDTKDIIMMYPAKKCEKLPYIDINYIKEAPKVKRISQIDKFNRRYNRK